MCMTKKELEAKVEEIRKYKAMIEEANIAPELFEDRINSIFMYQMEKKIKQPWKWKAIHKLILSCIG